MENPQEQQSVEKWSKQKTWTILGGVLLVSSFLSFISGDDNKQKEATAQVKGITQEKVHEEQVVAPKEEIKVEPVVEIKEEIKKEEVGYETVKKDDYSILKGEKEVKQEGKNGTKETKYKVTYLDGEEVKRELLSEEVTIEPLEEIILVGTKVEKVAPVARKSSGYTCNCSKTCPKMSSCAEAQYQLNVCGCSRRDGDNDGIACDADCQ